MHELIDINGNVTNILEINKQNLRSLRIRRETLEYSPKQFFKNGLYSSEDKNKTELTNEEIVNELTYLNKKEKMLIKLISKGENNGN